MRTQILDQRQIRQKIKRLAYQIWESNYKVETLLIAGIEPNGNVLAARIADILQEISELEVLRGSLNVQKKNPLEPIVCNGFLKEQAYSIPVILVDDVLNTGKTMIYGVKFFLELAPASLQTVVLIDRDHITFPVRADFCGLRLSTNLQEHVEVQLNDLEDAVYLH